MFYLIIRALAIVLYKILFRLQAYGRKNVPQTGGFILASNHASYLDPPALAATCPRKLCFLAKEELFKIVFLKQLISALNTYPVNSRSADFSSLRRAIKELKQGKGLTIFPEGRRTADGRIDQPSKGIGFLAAKTAVPIVPAFIEGSNKAWPVDSKFIRPKKIKVYFGKAIQPQQLRGQLQGEEYYQRIAEATMEEISRLRQNSKKRRG